LSGLKGKIAWVTGGGSGIGQAAAVELAKGGATVVVSGRRASALSETEALIGSSGGKGESEALDITDLESVRRAAKAIFVRHDHVDILVNCAGINIPKRFFKDLDAAEWDRVVGINLNGALYCTLAVLPSMRERRDGLVLKTIPFPVPAPSAADLVQRFQRAITEKTRVILVCHITNLTGQILPVDGGMLSVEEAELDGLPFNAGRMRELFGMDSLTLQKESANT